MSDAGHMALIITMVVAGYAAIASFTGAWRRVPELTASGRYAFYSIPVLLTVTTVALIYAFVIRDFSVRYVAENSNLAMPQIYTWVAFYAGNAGSLLYLALIYVAMAVAAVVMVRRKLPYTAPYVTGILALFLLFFIGVMLFLANPLERLPITPADGQGINPLLIRRS